MHLTAEEWGLVMGMELASELSFRRVEVKSDALVWSGVYRRKLLSRWISCTEHCKSCWLDCGRFKMKYKPRIANACTDSLAKHGLALEMGKQV